MNPIQILDAINNCDHGNRMNTSKIYSADIVLPILRNAFENKEKYVEIGENSFKSSSLRYRAFSADNGTTCVSCGLKGEYMAVQQNTNGNEKRPHMNLFGIKDGKAILFTKDHIMPKCKGDNDNISNIQTMCYHCNQLKGGDLPK